MTHLIESVLYIAAAFVGGRTYERWQIAREKRRRIAENRITTTGGTHQ